MSPAGPTLPAAGIGVWNGAAVMVHDRVGFVFVVGHDRGTAYVWLPPTAIQPAAMVTPSVARLLLDLTHRPTRLEVDVRLEERDPRARAILGAWLLWGTTAAAGPIADALGQLRADGDTRLPDGARVVDVQALAIVAAQVFEAASHG